MAGTAPAWLVAFAVIGTALAVATGDPPSRFGTGYLFSGPAAQGAPYVLVWAWITVVAVVAIYGRRRETRASPAAALSAGGPGTCSSWPAGGWPQRRRPPTAVRDGRRPLRPCASWPWGP